jgi:hypothetical protein
MSGERARSASSWAWVPAMTACQRYNVVRAGDLRYAAAKLNHIALGTIPGTTTCGEMA